MKYIKPIESINIFQYIYQLKVKICTQYQEFLSEITKQKKLQQADKKCFLLSYITLTQNSNKKYHSFIVHMRRFDNVKMTVSHVIQWIKSFQCSVYYLDLVLTQFLFLLEIINFVKVPKK